MVLLHLHCPSGASLRYAVCHTSCSSYGIRYGSYCVLHATSLITSFVPLHYTSFVARPFAARPGILANPHISAAFTLRLLIAHVVPPFRKASLRFTCIVQPPPYPDGKFTAAASYGGSIVGSPILLIIRYGPSQSLLP